MKGQEGLLYLNKQAREKGTGDHQSCETQQRYHGEKELKHVKCARGRDAGKSTSPEGWPAARELQRHHEDLPCEPSGCACPDTSDTARGRQGGGLWGCWEAPMPSTRQGMGCARAAPDAWAGPTEVPGSAMEGTAQGDARPEQQVLVLLTTQVMGSTVTEEGTEVSPSDDCDVTCPDCSYLGTDSDPAACARTPAERGARCGAPGLGAGSELRAGHSTEPFTPEPLKDVPWPCQVQADGARGRRAQSS